MAVATSGKASPFLQEAGIGVGGSSLPTWSGSSPSNQTPVRAKATGRKEPSKKGPFVAGQPTVTAKFAGRCKLCGGMIGVGATITLVGEAWVHEKCAPK